MESYNSISKQPFIFGQFKTLKPKYEAGLMTIGRTVNNQSNPQLNGQLDQDTFTKDVEKLANYCEEQEQNEDSLKSTVLGCLPWVALGSPQTIKHPINAVKAMLQTDKMFKTEAAKEFCKNNPELAQKAYTQTHAVIRNMQSKLPIIGGWFQKPLKGESLKQAGNLVSKMGKALETGSAEEVAEMTATLEASRGVDGYAASIYNNTIGKVRSFFGADAAKNLTPNERVMNKLFDGSQTIESAVSDMTTLSTMGKIGKEFKGFAIFDTAIHTFTKIYPAFRDGGFKSGVKQIGQSALEIVANCGGWALGKTAGTAVGASVGELVGSLICPGVGTIVGSVIGLACGFVGSWLGEKAVKCIMPKDEAQKLADAKKLSSKEGQAELLNTVQQKIQNGEEVPEDVVRAATNVASNLNVA